MNPKKKRGAKDNVICRGFGKCMKMEMDIIVETEVVKEECVLAPDLSNLEKEKEVKIYSESDEDQLKEFSNLKTIFRFEPNEKCKYKCKLQKCDNHKVCGNMMPQWSLNLGRGYCEQCIENGYAAFHKDLLDKKRRYTI